MAVWCEDPALPAVPAKRAFPTAREHMDVLDVSGDFTHIPAKAIALPFTKGGGISPVMTSFLPFLACKGSSSHPWLSSIWLSSCWLQKHVWNVALTPGDLPLQCFPVAINKDRVWRAAIGAAC